MLTGLLLFILFLLCLYFALRKPTNLPPGVWGLPLLGKFPSSSQRFADQVKELRPRYGDIITWRVGGRIQVFLCNYITIKRVLNKQEFQDRPDFATFIAYGAGDLRGVIVGNGTKWLMHRRFMLRQLRNLGMGKSKAEEAIQEEAALMVQDFKKHTNEDKTLPMSLGVAVFNVIWKMVANKRFEPDETEAHDIIRLVWEMNQSLQKGKVMLFNFLPLLAACAPEWLKRRWGLQKARKLTEKINQVTKEYVDEHLKTFNRLYIRDLIDEYLLAMEDDNDISVYSLEDLYLVATDLLVAGVETTTNTMRWAILYLAKFPEVQRRVQREIDNVIPRGTLPMYQHKSKLPYFEAVLSEVHRIASLVPLAVPHVASKDTELEGYSIPKGTVLYPHLECCHRDPTLWERPDEFYPEHFLDADGKYINKEGLLPFSVGRRVCAGESLARVELFIFLLALLQNFTFSAPKGEKLSTEVDLDELFLNICKPFRIIISERQ
ncbi:cytochrome P450 2L1-like [Eriocheir sinensis]|uniref:cytochrome P450 2L1-like n=1 Tax=Eriocheir sinensis TaxID=95602 RepID=UPI0021C9772E|nr:cytochrome P450 2L1-like [Eriocheir sinensis]